MNPLQILLQLLPLLPGLAANLEADYQSFRQHPATGDKIAAAVDGAGQLLQLMQSLSTTHTNPTRDTDG